MISRGKFQSCYISAPLGTELTALRRALEKRRIAWSDESRLEPSDPVASTILRTIDAVDFVCIVLAERYSATNVFVELGIALGRKKPILAFVDPKVELPFLLQRLPYARAAVNDVEAVSLHLDSFLTNAPKRGLKRTARKARKSAAFPEEGASTSIDLLNTYDSTRFEIQVAKLFEQSGAIVEVSPRLGPSEAADFALWIDAVQEVIGNPVLVEVKHGHLSSQTLDDAEERLRNSLRKIGGNAGLLIYSDVEGRELPASRFELPLVLRLRFQELVDIVKTGRLGRELIALRNRAIHGV